MKLLPLLCAIDNRGIVGSEHCYGAPFIAKDLQQAKDMVVMAVEKEKDNLDLSKFYLVLLCNYDFSSSFPWDNGSVIKLGEFCIADFFESEEVNPADDVCPGPRGDEGVMTGVGFYDDLEVEDE